MVLDAYNVALKSSFLLELMVWLVVLTLGVIGLVFRFILFYPCSLLLFSIDIFIKLLLNESRLDYLDLFLA